MTASKSLHEFVTEELAIVSRDKWLRLGWHPFSIFYTDHHTWAFWMND